MKDARYIVGIDLGTTNCVVAYVKISADAKSDANTKKSADTKSNAGSKIAGTKSDAGAKIVDRKNDAGAKVNASAENNADVTEKEKSEIMIFQIPQLTDAGVIDKRDVLPSFLYIKDAHELSSDSLKLPWQGIGNIVAGEFARERGGEVPHKLISSSKSWLCNQAVDRESLILPWETTGKLEKLSPVQASCALINHIKDAWNYEMANGDDDLKLEHQAIYLTVPASFDAVARELTVKAAQMAGLEDIVLIEEPQAAFYSWIDKAGEKWRENVEKGDMVLVCDIGGGTSDFSLIEVKEDKDGLLELERVAVGNHLLVGGDNIDLALSYFLAARLREKKRKLDSWQMRALVHSCRKAKENLFSAEGAREEYPVTVLGRGSGLIKGTIKQSLTLEDVQKVVLDGFFPICDLSDKPAGSSATGMKEFGLSYEADPAITRHLAKFISDHKDDQGWPRLPSAVIFNGGVMKSLLMKNRVMDVLQQWHKALGSKEVREIDAVDFDLSVALGASYYGQAARGDGIKIRGGLGMSYYMAIEASMPAIPGVPMPTRALCIAPFGMEEGSEAESRDRLFNLVVGEKVNFDIMTSATRHEDMLGKVIDNWEDMDITEITSIETRLDGKDEGFIPVTFEVKLTEVGTLEFWACSRDDDRKWRLELNVRPKD